MGGEVEGAGVPDQPGLHREMLPQNPSARAAVSGRVLTERAQVEFLHRSKRGENLELLEKESDVGWPEARGREEI